jgi:hypothetical protein
MLVIVEKWKRLLAPMLGTLLGAAAGFAYYWWFGCDSG